MSAPCKLCGKRKCKEYNHGLILCWGKLKDAPGYVHKGYASTGADKWFPQREPKVHASRLEEDPIFVWDRVWKEDKAKKAKAAEDAKKQKLFDEIEAYVPYVYRHSKHDPAAMLSEELGLPPSCLALGWKQLGPPAYAVWGVREWGFDTSGKLVVVAWHRRAAKKLAGKRHQLPGGPVFDEEGLKRSYGNYAPGITKRRGLTLLEGWDRCEVEGLGNTLFLIEGASDATCLKVMGLACVGRPSNMDGGEILIRLLKDRPEFTRLVVVGENDRNDEKGTWPGKQGMHFLAGQLAQAMPDRVVEMGMLPEWLGGEKVKDSRDWYKAVEAPTAEAFVAALTIERATAADIERAAEFGICREQRVGLTEFELAIMRRPIDLAARKAERAAFQYDPEVETVPVSCIFLHFRAQQEAKWEEQLEERYLGDFAISFLTPEERAAAKAFHLKTRNGETATEEELTAERVRCRKVAEAWRRDTPEGRAYAEHERQQIEAHRQAQERAQRIAEAREEARKQYQCPNGVWIGLGHKTERGRLMWRKPPCRCWSCAGCRQVHIVTELATLRERLTDDMEIVGVEVANDCWGRIRKQLNRHKANYWWVDAGEGRRAIIMDRRVPGVEGKGMSRADAIATAETYLRAEEWQERPCQFSRGWAKKREAKPSDWERLGRIRPGLTAQDIAEAAQAHGYDTDIKARDESTAAPEGATRVEVVTAVCKVFDEARHQALLDQVLDREFEFTPRRRSWRHDPNADPTLSQVEREMQVSLLAL